MHRAKGKDIRPNFGPRLRMCQTARTTLIVDHLGVSRLFRGGRFGIRPSLGQTPVRVVWSFGPPERTLFENLLELLYNPYTSE